MKTDVTTGDVWKEYVEVPSVKTISECRVCHSEMLTPLFSLREQYVSNFVEADQVMAGPKVPLDLLLCRSCGLVQLRHTAPQEFLYSRHYWYRSGTTQTMRDALRDVTASAERLVKLKPGEVVLDIGSNDGCLLRSYTAPGIVRVGFEPAVNLAEEGRKGVDVFFNDFWSFERYNDYNTEPQWLGPKVRIATAIGMFYDLDDPNAFIRDVAAVLADDGIFIAQLMCLKHMLDACDLGNICHEHLEYYSLHSLQVLFERNGLELFDVEENAVNGGSYRLYVRKVKNTLPPRPADARHRLEMAFKEEARFGEPALYHDFFQRIEANKERCLDFLFRAHAAGKRTWVYGASTKGNTLLQFYGLDHSLIDGASDRSPEKHGKFTVGSGIPIVSEEEARKAKPDYFLVLPYSFINEFVIREAEWRDGGGKFLVPLPEFRVL